MKRYLAILVLAAVSGTSSAQQRSLPPEAKRGEIRHVHGMMVEIDGTPQRLAPGAQIRNASNVIILPTSLPAGSRIKYELDAERMVRRVWILTDEEAAKD